MNKSLTRRVVLAVLCALALSFLGLVAWLGVAYLARQAGIDSNAAELLGFFAQCSFVVPGMWFVLGRLFT